MTDMKVTEKTSAGLCDALFEEFDLFGHLRCSEAEMWWPS